MEVIIENLEEVAKEFEKWFQRWFLENGPEEFKEFVKEKFPAFMDYNWEIKLIPRTKSGEKIEEADIPEQIKKTIALDKVKFPDERKEKIEKKNETKKEVKKTSKPKKGKGKGKGKGKQKKEKTEEVEETVEEK